MANEIHELGKALAISPHSAKLYFSALQRGGGTLTELARNAELSRTILPKPINELLENGLLAKRLVGKRMMYTALNPQQLPTVLEKKKQKLIDISRLLLQQISASEQDLQIRWFSGIHGVETGMMEFYTRAKGSSFRFWESVEAFNYISRPFADSVLQTRIRRGITTRVIVISDTEMDSWYRAHLSRDKEQLRESIVLSANEYPFKANMGAGDELTLIFEYREKPFALLIENRVLAQSIRAIHQMVWERYQAK